MKFEVTNLHTPDGNSLLEVWTYGEDSRKRTEAATLISLEEARDLHFQLSALLQDIDHNNQERTASMMPLSSPAST